jgi:hypothetical protein
MAAPLSGTFNMSGDMTSTGSTMDFSSDLSPFAPDSFTMSGGTGSFVGINGQEAIADIANEAVNTTFASAGFITISGLTPTLLIDELYGGTGSNTGCSAPVAAGGHVHTQLFDASVWVALHLRRQPFGHIFGDVRCGRRYQ